MTVLFSSIRLSSDTIEQKQDHSYREISIIGLAPSSQTCSIVTLDCWNRPPLYYEVTNKVMRIYTTARPGFGPPENPLLDRPWLMC